MSARCCAAACPIRSATPMRGRNTFRCCWSSWRGAAPTSSRQPRLRFDAEQFCRGGAENLDAIGVAQAGDRHDVIDRRGVPREWVIGAEEHVIDAGLGEQVEHPLAGEHDRVEIELTATD